MKLGISTYALTWSIGVPSYESPVNPLSAIGFIELAYKNGIQLVQFADNLPLHKKSRAELLEIQSYAAERNISFEVGTRGTDPDHMLNYLNIAKLLDAKLFRTLITSSELKEAEKQLRQVLPHFKDAGVCIAVENHGLHTTKQLAALFENINDPMLGCCLDTVNSFSALDSPETVINDLAPYTLNLHIKDFNITRVDHQMGFVVLGTPAGSGKLDIPRIITTLKKHRKETTAILELWTPFTNHVEETIKLENDWFNQSIKYLKTLDFSE